MPQFTVDEDEERAQGTPEEPQDRAQEAIDGDLGPQDPDSGNEPRAPGTEPQLTPRSQRPGSELRDLPEGPDPEPSDELLIEAEAQESQPRRRRRIPQAHYDTLALMILNQVPLDQIADSMGTSKQAISYYTKGKSEGFNRVLESYRERLVRTTTHHRIRLLDMMNEAYTAIQQGLRSDDQKLATDTAFKLMDRAHLTGERSEVNVNFHQNNIQVSQEVRQTFANLSEKFTELLDTAVRQDPNRHVRTGADALPQAITKAHEEVRSEEDPENGTETEAEAGEPDPSGGGDLCTDWSVQNSPGPNSLAETDA